MEASTYRVLLTVPRSLEVEGRGVDREEFFSWVWERFGEAGLLGVHEGTLLSEDAAREGLETESWTLDAAEAPRERDWVAGRASAEGELYFGSEGEARVAWEAIARAAPAVRLVSLEEQKPQDWDAQWKASFLNASDGVGIPPFWRVLPPWVGPSEAGLKPGEVALRINPGAGFGTGTHETTQLCLQAIAERAPLLAGGGRALDFGSGSGILSIGAALLGAQVSGVEIDPLAIDNALENARINGVEARIEYSRALGGAPGVYPVVIANILKPVLLEFSAELAKRVASGGALILSGLIESDVAAVSERYSELLGGRAPKVRALNEWRCLVWDRA